MMKPILSGLLFFTFLYLVSDVFVKYSSFGITPNAVFITLFGNEEEYLDPISKASFLEFWHVEIFFVMMILFTLSAVYIRLAEASKISIIVVNLMMISAIVTLVSLPMAYFLSSSFIMVYVISFFTWHICALFSVLSSLKSFYYA